MSSKQKIQKIPGDILPPFKTESQGYIDNLDRKQKFQLEELLERQNKIFANKKFLSKLPDKGQKIKSFRDEIMKEIEHKNEVEKAAKLLSRLNITSEGKTAISKLEWTGKFINKNDNETTNIVELDSDDEEPLKILAQPTGSGIHKKKIIYIASEKSLIKPDDIAEIESFKTDSLNVEHVKYIIDKVEKTEEIKKPFKKPFKPYKTTKSNVHDLTKKGKLSKNWVTAVTPSLTVYGAAKVLSLTESLQLQKEQTEKLYEIQAKHAIERLTNQKLHNIGVVSQNAENYCLQEHMNGSFSSSKNGEEHEIYDEEDNDKNGTVVYIESAKS